MGPVSGNGEMPVVRPIREGGGRFVDNRPVSINHPPPLQVDSVAL